METKIRSGCPINLTVEVIGDQWSLVILRDILVGGPRHFRELLSSSMEGIASNVLHTKLQRLVGMDLLRRVDDEHHSQKTVYVLTEQSIQLLPVFAALGSWGMRHRPATEAPSIRARLLEEGGPPLWDALMEDLRRVHIHGEWDRPNQEGSPLKRLNDAFNAACAKITKK